MTIDTYITHGVKDKTKHRIIDGLKRLLIYFEI